MSVQQAAPARPRRGVMRQAAGAPVEERSPGFAALSLTGEGHRTSEEAAARAAVSRACSGWRGVGLCRCAFEV